MQHGSIHVRSVVTASEKERCLMYCAKCGKEIDDEAVVCPHCGVATANMQAQQPQVIVNNTNTNASTNTNVNTGFGPALKSKTVTLLLAIFLGLLGIHRFYVGKVGTGLIWLFTGGLFGIGWIVDIICIIIGVFKDKYGRPLA